MAKLILTASHEIVNLQGKSVVLSLPVYNLSDDKLAINNEFFRCAKCKDFFDVACSVSEYHPDYDGKNYCPTHVQKSIVKTDC